MKLIPHNILDLRGSVQLPLSKSVRARELILDAVCGRPISIEDDNDDIFVLSKSLSLVQQSGLDRQIELDLHDSGTALRFLIAFCSATSGQYILRGSDRLSQRPIAGLVNSLRYMGANIKYIEKEGCAPLYIEGRHLKGGRIAIDSGVSSQYISALMLISSCCEEKVELRLLGETVSSKYICLTQSVIDKYSQGIVRSDEKDWSSAAVWYALVALSPQSQIILEGLDLNSAQPDSSIVDVFKHLGVKTQKVREGVRISNFMGRNDHMDINCIDMPDSAVYIAVAACLLDVKFRISGLSTLVDKECDRIRAITAELRKFGYVLKFESQSVLEWNGDKSQAMQNNIVESYGDHRIAMAMSLFGLFGPVEINNPHVVKKSYPNFWDEYSKFIDIE